MIMAIMEAPVNSWATAPCLARIAASPRLDLAQVCSDERRHREGDAREVSGWSPIIRVVPCPCAALQHALVRAQLYQLQQIPSPTSTNSICSFIADSKFLSRSRSSTRSSATSPRTPTPWRGTYRPSTASPTPLACQSRFRRHLQT